MAAAFAPGETLSVRADFVDGPPRLTLARYPHRPPTVHLRR
jgi:hypothetical protein